MRAHAALFLLLCLGFTEGCDRCSNQIMRTLPSPNGRHTAILFERNCGVTTGISTQIAIIATAAKQHKADDVFIADSNHGRIPVDTDGLLNVDIGWRSDAVLSITYPSQARILLKAPGHQGVKIAYQEK
jgi:hypothetical protein